MRPSSVLALIAFTATTYSAQPACPPNPDWSYGGVPSPSRWGERWPLCGRGEAQSPINIPRDLHADEGPAIEFHYRPFDLVVENTSHFVAVPVANGSYIAVSSHRFELVQLEVHVPSEHLIAGKGADLELQLIHRDENGRTAIVGILASDAAANPALGPIVSALPVAACERKDTHVRFDPGSLLPARRDYYTYVGSLTTPGCDEGVMWLVLVQPITVSPEQRAALGSFGGNARPVQPLNGRPISRVIAVH